MDIKKLAAEKKAKALADLRDAEAMEQDAAQIERMAAKHGWHIDIVPTSPDAPKPSAAEGSPSGSVDKESTPKKTPGKVADPNSTTSRSKSESINVIRQLGRPVPLSELNERIKALGVVIGGKNPTQALSANLGRCPELVATKRGWWLKGEKLPPKEKAAGVGRDELFTGLN
jgi:hypothetical protein